MTTASKRRKFAIFAISLSVATFFATVVSLVVGKYDLSFGTVFDIVFGGATRKMDCDVFFNLRLPRTLLALIGGFALGLAGHFYQTVFKNPLASPDVIGVSSGANTGAAIAIVLTGAVAGSFQIAIGAFLGAICTVACVFALTRAAKSRSTATYILAGIVMNALARSLVMLVKYFADADSQLVTLEFWEMGTLGNVTMTKFLSVLPFLAVGITALVLMRRPLSMLSLGERECRALGVRTRLFRPLGICFSTLLVSSVVSVTGLVSFVGLISPHIARQALRSDNANTPVLSGLVGALVVLCSDIIVRALPNAELPISVVTALFGLPVLVIFACRKGGRND